MRAKGGKSIGIDSQQHTKLMMKLTEPELGEPLVHLYHS